VLTYLVKKERKRKKSERKKREKKRGRKRKGKKNRKVLSPVHILGFQPWGA
jgi:hypothetical protein